jgi:hypothetical protein
LQNPTENSATVVWAISAPATGYVEFGETPEPNQKVITDQFGLTPYDDRFIQTRLTGLQPGKTYYYRTVTEPLDFQNGYKIIHGDLIKSDVYSFRTPTAESETASFAVINDTHNDTPQAVQKMQVLTKKLAELNADYTIWNGDIIGDYKSDEQAILGIARPSDIPFAAEKPLLFVRGNHDYRGVWARNIPRLFTPWLHELKYSHLGYNFAVRQGALAIIGLDTGEDKPDKHPQLNGRVQGEPLKYLQAEWLEETLKRPEIASAPYIVAFCHIPLYDPRPNANPGTTLEGYAAYSGLGLELWGKILDKAGVQLLVTAHQHAYRYWEPGEGRCWAEVVGGGPELGKTRSVNSATVIHGIATKEKLTVTIYNMFDDSVAGTFEYKARG